MTAAVCYLRQQQSSSAPCCSCQSALLSLARHKPRCEWQGISGNEYRVPTCHSCIRLRCVAHGHHLCDFFLVPWQSLSKAEPLPGPLMTRYRQLARRGKPAIRCTWPRRCTRRRPFSLCCRRGHSLWLSLGGFQEVGPDAEHMCVCVIACYCLPQVHMLAAAQRAPCNGELLRCCQVQLPCHRGSNWRDCSPLPQDTLVRREAGPLLAQL